MHWFSTKNFQRNHIETCNQKNNSNQMNLHRDSYQNVHRKKNIWGFQYPNLCGLPCPCEVWWLGRWVWHLQSGNRWFLDGLAFRPFVFVGEGGWLRGWLKLRVLPWRWRLKIVCLFCLFFWRGREMVSNMAKRSANGGLEAYLKTWWIVNGHFQVEKVWENLVQLFG